ncbi:MAG: phosphatidylglycerophosphatase A [Deltaproteobacteria bacterium CG23_combo_of_CG06-09_8_20_14_all_60_8]|nr:MAG: phosphatidylglycerophosphatase A [Deltaproteobacteria bacterium CG23_combo_of_CG06-09_8_20_14_all_60_8]
MALATGLYTGYLPKASGTWGSLVALPIHFGLIHLAPTHHGLALAAILLLAVWTAGSAEKILDQPDPQVVVIDEIVGMLIVLAGAPNTPLAWLLGFALFRFFDILKPWPASFCDKNLHGGLGIVLDDVVAGLYALLALRVLLWVGQA